MAVSPVALYRITEGPLHRTASPPMATAAAAPTNPLPNLFAAPDSVALALALASLAVLAMSPEAIESVPVMVLEPDPVMDDVPALVVAVDDPEREPELELVPDAVAAVSPREHDAAVGSVVGRFVTPAAEQRPFANEMTPGEERDGLADQFHWQWH